MRNITSSLRRMRPGGGCKSQLLCEGLQCVQVYYCLLPVTFLFVLSHFTVPVVLSLISRTGSSWILFLKFEFSFSFCLFQPCFLNTYIYDILHERSANLNGSRKTICHGGSIIFASSFSMSLRVRHPSPSVPYILSQITGFHQYGDVHLLEGVVKMYHVSIYTWHDIFWLNLHK